MTRPEQPGGTLNKKGEFVRIHHPVPREEITDETYRAIATDLFERQMGYNISYHAQIVTYGWSDDDTDYMRTMFNASEVLMDIAYDGSCKDLIDFLFTSRTDYEKGVDYRKSPNHPTIMHEPLHVLDSAGGLTHELNSYLQPLYDEEDRDGS